MNERGEKANLQKLSEQLKAENKEYCQQLLKAHEEVEKQRGEINTLAGEKRKLEKIRDEHNQMKVQFEATKQLLEIRNQKIEKLE
jgi:chromosome segregation ATPase